MVLENVKSSSYAHVVEDTNEESVCAMHVVSSMPNDIVEDSFFVEKDYIMKIQVKEFVHQSQAMTVNMLQQ